MLQRREGEKAQGLLWPETSKPQAARAENTMSHIAWCQATNSGPQAAVEVHCTATDIRHVEEHVSPNVLPPEGATKLTSLGKATHPTWGSYPLSGKNHRACPIDVQNSVLEP